MPALLPRLAPERLAGLGFVVLLHAALLYGLLSQRLLPLPADLAPVFVEFITPPAPPPPAKTADPAKPVRLDKPRPVTPPPPQQVVAETVAPTETPAPAPRAEPPAPVGAAAVAAPAAPAGPVRLDNELSLSCPNRTPPAYPAHLRRRGVEGSVTLRVELDEQGAVSAATVLTGSGSDALDGAALAAVRQWQCQPPRRDGRPVRAVALQPFNFTLQGR